VTDNSKDRRSPSLLLDYLAKQKEACLPRLVCKCNRRDSKAHLWTRAAQVAALAASVTLSTIPLAADQGANSRLVGAGAGSGTMDQALVQAYQNNPQLNSQRAATRAIDENVPTALAGFRPRVSGTASLTDQYLDQLIRAGTDPRTGGAAYSFTRGAIGVQSYGLTATQTLFNGLQTASRTSQAEGQVFSARETLRTTEQNVLLSAATAYMNLLQTAAILELQRSNVNVLEVTLRQTRAPPHPRRLHSQRMILR
jgi:outer membrane protein TolC